jgi:hypothetical protein
MRAYQQYVSARERMAVVAQITAQALRHCGWSRIDITLV